jgi:hypothetical protein
MSAITEHSIAPDPLVVAVRRTHEARQGYQVFAAQLAEERRKFEHEQERLIGLTAQSQRVVAAEETALRELALQRYEQTADKRPAPGVGIRLEKVVEITSAAAALEWAKTSGLALTVDTAALKRIAIASSIPCATVHEVPKAIIATDLGAALGLTVVPADGDRGTA